MTTTPYESRAPGALIDLDNLPPTVDLPTAARILGISRSAAYELARGDGWPTPILRLGRNLRVPTAPLLALLGVPRPATPSSP